MRAGSWGWWGELECLATPLCGLQMPLGTWCGSSPLHHPSEFRANRDLVGIFPLHLLFHTQQLLSSHCTRLQPALEVQRLPSLYPLRRVEGLPVPPTPGWSGTFHLRSTSLITIGCRGLWHFPIGCESWDHRDHAPLNPTHKMQNGSVPTSRKSQDVIFVIHRYSEFLTYRPSGCKLFKVQTCIPSTHQAWPTLQLVLCLLLPTILQLYHLPPPTSLPGSNSSCLFTQCLSLYASCCTLYCCAFKVLYCKIKNVLFLVFAFYVSFV